MMGLDVVLPPRCVVSGDIVGHQGALSPAAFAGLDFIAAPFCARCGMPFDFETAETTICTGCLLHPPSFGRARAALKYNDASRKMILAFKHGDQIHAAASFAPWMRRAGMEVVKGADMIAPVPLHRWRLLRRRYNQAMILARYLSNICDVPACPRLLVRIRATQTQGHLSPKQRLENIRGAFAVNSAYAQSIANKVILVIDDVYTTGATVNECARILLREGAREVRVLTLARAVRDMG